MYRKCEEILNELESQGKIKVNKDYKFPEKEELKFRLKNMLEDNVDEKYYLSQKMMNYIVSEDDKYKVNKDLLVANRDIEGNTRADTSDYVIQNESQTNIDLEQVIQVKSAYLRNYGSKGKLQENNVCDTLQASMGTGGGNVPILKVKNNTKQGYLEAYEGDGVYTNISTKRGTVTPQAMHTLTSYQDAGVVVNYKTKNKRIIKLANELDQYKGTLFMDIYNQKNLELCGTLKNGMDHQQGNIIYNDLRIRKLTPKECWRLMGFTDEEFEKAEKVNSNSQLYKQAGNSIVVNVLEKILKNLL